MYNIDINIHIYNTNKYVHYLCFLFAKFFILILNTLRLHSIFQP